MSVREGDDVTCGPPARDRRAIQRGHPGWLIVSSEATAGCSEPSRRPGPATSNNVPARPKRATCDQAAMTPAQPDLAAERHARLRATGTPPTESGAVTMRTQETGTTQINPDPDQARAQFEELAGRPARRRRRPDTGSAQSATPGLDGLDAPSQPRTDTASWPPASQPTRSTATSVRRGSTTLVAGGHRRNCGRPRRSDTTRYRQAARRLRGTTA